MKDNTSGIQRSPDYRYPKRTEWGQNGFLDIAESTVGFVNGTRTFTITPVGTDGFTFFVEGIRYVKFVAESIVITDVEGIHLIYYDGSTLTEIVNPTNTQIDTILRTKNAISYILWDLSAVAQIYFGEARHGSGMAPDTHAYIHFAQGLTYFSGIGLSSMLVDQDGSLNSHAQFATDLGVVADADVIHSIAAVGSTTGLPNYYMLGAAADWQKDVNAGFSVRTFDDTNTTRLAYNQYTGGAWQLTQAASGTYVLGHIFATTESTTPMISIMGQATYATKKAARTGALTEVVSLISNNIIFPGVRAIASVIFETDLAYTNDVNARVISTEEGDNYIDWRSQTIERVEFSTNDHGSLNGLIHDDHLQYFLLAGRVTGQVLIGGTAANDDITFQTTSDGTKGDYIFTELNTVGGLVQTDGSGVFSTSITLPDGTLATTQGALDNSTKVSTTAYADAAVAAAYKISKGDSSVEVIDTGTDGRIVITADGAEKWRVDKDYIYLKEDVFTDLTAANVTTNTFFGVSVLNVLSTGGNNTAIGYEAMASQTTLAHYNTFVGSKSGKGITTGGLNVGVGFSNFAGTTTGDGNIAIGPENFTLGVTGSYNTIISYYGMAGAIVSGSYNIGIGDYALGVLSSGVGNIAIGSNALSSSLATSNYNVAVGHYAGQVVTGANNTLLGAYAGDVIVAGTDNIMIGYNIDPPGGVGATYELNIGDTLYGDLTNDLIGIGSKPTDTYLLSKAGTTAYSSLQVPHGVAPTAPTNGDWWSTTVGFYARINGATGLIALNPLTTVGDIIYSSATVVAARLGLGTQHHVLRAGASIPEYGLLVNANIAASATADIAWNKLVASTADRVVVTDGSGYPIVSATITTTELGLLNGMTSLASADKIFEGDSSVEVIDTGIDGRVVITADGAEKWRVDKDYIYLKEDVFTDLTAANVTTNTFFGVSVLNVLSTGGNNTAIGYEAMASQTTLAHYNTFVGSKSGKGITTGGLNVGVGFSNFAGTTTGDGNIAIGPENFTLGVTGSYNTIISYYGMAGAIVSGSYNIGIGDYALGVLSSGVGNIAIGSNALSSSLATSNYNVAVGHYAGQVVTGANNTLLGAYAGDVIVAGTDNIMIGYNIDPPGGVGATYELNIGDTLYGDLTNDLIGIGSKPTDTYLLSKAGTTAYSSLQVPHGVAPTAPTNGDWWSTTVGFYARINGATGLIALNPLTTVGDIIYSSATVVAARLGLGTQHHVLRAGASIPEYGLLVNANIAASATADIAWNKLVASTADRVVVTDGSGYPIVSATITTTELGLLNGMTSLASADKIFEGDSSVEVIDTGIDGRVVITADGAEKFRIDKDYIYFKEDVKTDDVLSSNTNTFFGINAVPAALTHGIGDQGYYNTLFGNEAGMALSLGNNNIAIGYKAFSSALSAAFNVIIGNEAYSSATAGGSNVIIGLGAMKIATSSYNTVIGTNSGSVMTSGGNSTFVGYLSGYKITGAENVFIGSESAGGLTGGAAIGNVGIGFKSLLNLQATGNSNIAIGHNAGDVITTGSNNIIIGHNVDPSNGATSTYELNIGNTLYGNLSTDSIGIGLRPTANMLGLSVEAGLLTLKERATPTADANYGKIYTKNDNKIYFQDGAGAEHEIAFV